MATDNADISLEKKLDGDNVSISRVKSVSAGEIVNLDASEVFLREHNFSDEYLAELLADEQMNKKLVRKIDFVVLPLLAGTYVLQYLDKQSMSVCKDLWKQQTGAEEKSPSLHSHEKRNSMRPCSTS